jgi:hypothetical protein
LAGFGRSGGLTLQKLVEIRGGRGWEQLTEAILASQRKGGVDHVLDEARPVCLHTLPGTDPHAGAPCRFLLGPPPPNPTSTDGLPKFQPQLFRGLQHGSFMAFYLHFFNIIDQI